MLAFDSIPVEEGRDCCASLTGPACDCACCVHPETTEVFCKHHCPCANADGVFTPCRQPGCGALAREIASTPKTTHTRTNQPDPDPSHGLVGSFPIHVIGLRVEDCAICATAYPEDHTFPIVGVGPVCGACVETGRLAAQVAS